MDRFTQGLENEDAALKGQHWAVLHMMVTMMVTDDGDDDKFH